MKWVYQALGITKQAYHKRIKSDQTKLCIEKKVLAWVADIRKRMPKTGTRKLYEHLQDLMKEHRIKMGRDALFTLLRKHGILVRRTKRFHITTDSNHYFYKSPNLIKDLTVTHSEQVFVSDITYISIDAGHAYLALVTDAYSKKIMGWQLDDNMKVSLVKDALNMANNQRIFNQEKIIHHSDRGIQYCCPDYSTFAENKGYILSTTQKYDPYENAIAERINGILKYEFGLKNTIANINLARKMINQAVHIYNNERLHWSLDLLTPNHVHENYNKQKYKSYASNYT